jgi:hypothetical protein
MNHSLPAPIRLALLLARYLEEMDANRQTFDAGQYLEVARRLSGLLASRDIDWTPLLTHSPAAATLYENLHYAKAGLCRSDLDAALRAEIPTLQIIKAARRRQPTPGAPAG